MPLIRLDAVDPRPLQWLWYPRLPLGRLSILYGHPDRGKSLVALTCAAHLSCQRPWPDGQPCPLGTSLVLEAEDSLEETVIPRLKAAGADLSRIFTFHERHLGSLGSYLKEITPSLVIFSPLNTYLPRLTNTWNDKSVRDSLQPLADLALRSHAAFLAIMHPPKRFEGLPVYAIGGSAAFGGIARSVLMVDHLQPDALSHSDPSSADQLFLLESVKGNLASRQVPPLGYRLSQSPEDAAVSVVRWEPVHPTLSLIPPDEEASSLSTACAYLRMALADGPQASTNIHDSAHKQGISDRTLKRARKLLGVVAREVPAGHRSHWQLSLPQPPV